MALNIIIFFAMVFNGAGFLHSPNEVQLNWGANFGPATQDGEWWRLGSAMFLHFGIIHLGLNMLALWESGQLVERMYGRLRFIGIYLLSGLFGNLVSLVMQGGGAIAGGASGAIFGVYGAALVFLWRERAAISVREFRLLFGGAIAFSILTIGMGFLVSGIDNGAHIGGLIAGILLSISFSKSITARAMPIKYIVGAAGLLLGASVYIGTHLPKPSYSWNDERLLRSVIGEFVAQDQEINRAWINLSYDAKQGDKPIEEIIKDIDLGIHKPYESSLDMLLDLPDDPSLPSAQKLEQLRRYTEIRKQKSELVIEDLKAKAELENQENAKQENLHTEDSTE